MTDDERLIPRGEVESRTGLSRSTIYRLMRAGQFPTPIRVGPRAVRWKLSEVNAYLAPRPRATGESGGP